MNLLHTNLQRMSYKILILLGILSFSVAWAQTDSTQVADSREMNKPTDPPRTNSLILTRGLMLGASAVDSVPLNGFASGTFSLQIGIKKYLIGNSAGLRFSPGVSFTTYDYNQTDIKRFPSIPDSVINFERERQNLTFVELPIGIFVDFNHDEDGDTKFFVEAGGYIGYLLGARYQTRYSDGNGLRVDNQISRLQRLESEYQRLRYGIYARAGYKWASLYFGMRLTPVWDEFANEITSPTGSTNYVNPTIPPMELGISIIL